MIRLAISLCVLPVWACFAQDLPATVVTPSPVKPEAPAPAEAAPPADEKAIPDAFPVARYEASWNKNPFLLKTAAIAQVQESWAKDFALTSLAEIDGVFRVSIKNKVTGESKRLVQGQEGDSEFKIVTVNLQPNRKESSVQIAKGSETADLKYDETQTTAQGRPAPGQPVAGRVGMPTMPGTSAARGTVVASAGAGGIPGRISNNPVTTGRPTGYQPNAAGNPSISAPGYANNLPQLPTSSIPPGMPVPPAPRSYSGATAPSSPALSQVPNGNGAVPTLSLGAGSAPLSTPAVTPIPTTATGTNPTDPATTPNPNAPSPVTRRRTLIPAPVLPQ